uniref:Uncharacterized protein n=1 Tax=Picea sitchensis TaxID=3332 RepID=A9NZ85_PICSI|nr:unknown [Picea sitchensis]
MLCPFRRRLSGNTRVRTLGKCMLVDMMRMPPCFLVLQRYYKNASTCYRELLS